MVLDLSLYVPMDGLYLPNGRQLSLIDRDWIVDRLPHLGNPDDNLDANYLLASAVVANSGTSITTGESRGGPSHGTTTHTTVGVGSSIETGTGANIIINHHNIGASLNHSLLYNSEEFEGDLNLLSEIVDETQNKWSDFGVNQLLTSYARLIRSTFK